MQTIIYEPISKEKSLIILHANLLTKIDILKPNIIQLRDIFANIPGNDTQAFLSEVYSSDPQVIIKSATVMSQAILKFAQTTGGQTNRLRTIIVTLGEKGVLLYG